MSIRVATVIG